MNDLKEKINNLKTKILNIKEKIDFDSKTKKILLLEKETSRPDFWGVPENANKILKELKQLKQEVEFWQKKEEEIRNLEEIFNLLEKDKNSELIDDLEKKLTELESKVTEKELVTFLSGPYDKNEAIMILTAGQGGRDAEDFCRMLFKMYIAYFQKQNWDYQILHQHFSEEAGGSKEAGGEIGFKNVSLEINAPYAYGFLKNESGVHRLVRISPFDAKKLRHTSFVLVDVLPQIEDIDLKNIVLDEADLKVEFFRSSGPGGQNVNKRETAVRIIHLPTGLSAACQTERFQAQNREKALHLIKIKLFNLLKQQKKEEIQVLRKRVEPSWGNQIRNYVLHPYKLVKDLRTNIETNQVDEVLAGKIDDFIKAEMIL